MRSFLITFFCFIWAIALVAPAVVTLLDDTGVAMELPMHEDEHEEDGEKELEIPMMKEPLNKQAYSYAAWKGKADLAAYPGTDSLLHPEILLPPPKSC